MNSRGEMKRRWGGNYDFSDNMGHAIVHGYGQYVSFQTIIQARSYGGGKLQVFKQLTMQDCVVWANYIFSKVPTMWDW